MMTDWKQHHANEAEKILLDQTVQNVLSEFADNMGFKREGLPEYGLLKVVSYAAQIARAQALGFDPELLRLSPNEAALRELELDKVAAETGKPVYLIVREGLDKEGGDA